MNNKNKQSQTSVIPMYEAEVEKEVLKELGEGTTSTVVKTVRSKWSRKPIGEAVEALVSKKGMGTVANEARKGFEKAVKSVSSNANGIAGKAAVGVAIDLAYDKTMGALVPEDLKRKKEENAAELQRSADRGDTVSKVNFAMRKVSKFVPLGSQLVDSIDTAKAACDLGVEEGIRVSDREAALTAQLTVESIKARREQRDALMKNAGETQAAKSKV